MRDVAIVAFGQSPFSLANRTDDMAEILLPVVRHVLATAGIDRSEIGFYASGSHDFFEGRTFAYIESLDAVGAWPPISESHVEMDAAWALHEAWTWLQLNEGDIALVYGVGRGSLAQDLDQVLAAQLDPYFLAPLQPHRDALAALQACQLISSGALTELEMAEVVSRHLGRPVAELLDEPYVATPLRRHDIAPYGDAAAVVILAAGDAARRLAHRPAWIRGIDHRMDTHYPGMRDLTTAYSARLAGSKAFAMAGFGPSDVDSAELHTEYSYQEPLLVKELGLTRTVVNPGGGPLAGRPATATGLIRLGEAAQRVIDGDADRALAHATNGQALQQNLICLLEGA